MEHDPVQDALRLVSKLNAELTALSFFVSELVATECDATASPYDHLKRLGAKVQERLEQMSDEEATNWARQRVELVLLHAQDRL
jgi:hypothetical protein